MLTLSDYDYHLPPELIAQSPTTPPESARCLFWNGGKLEDKTVADLPHLLDPKTLIIFNDTKVVKARIALIHAIRTTKDGQKEILSKGEVFFLNYKNQDHFDALVNPGKKFQKGDIISQDDWSFEVKEITQDGRVLKSSKDINSILKQYGQMPLPPYIHYDETLTHRYQSIMAQHDGSVAAPTASLHFSPELIGKLKQQGHQIATVTLHVGLGTFKTVHTEDITQHDIHDEKISIPHSLRDTIAIHKLKNLENQSDVPTPSLGREGWGELYKNPILAIGTTVTRTLESLPYIRKLLRANSQWPIAHSQHTTELFRDNITKNISLDQAKQYISNLEIHDFSLSCSTKIFLYPGKKFHIIDLLLTNFHLPKSSLLMLVAAFMGYENMMTCYHHAIREKYRFFSFGDCMLIKTKLTI